MAKNGKNKQQLNSKAVKEMRAKKLRKASYIGAAIGLFAIGIIGLTVWLVNFSPNYTAYTVNGTEISKDIYNCAYFYETEASDNWTKYGFDTSINPYEQKLKYDFNDGDYDTWGDYFEHLTNNTLKFCYSMIDMAQKGGYEYTSEVEKNVKNDINTVNKERLENSATFKQYMMASYGSEIDKKTLEEFLTVYYKATEFYKNLTEDKAVFCKYTGYSSNAISDLYDKNKNEYDSVSFRYCVLNDSDTSAQKVKKLQNAKSETEFKNLCNTYYKDQKNYAKNDASLYKDYSLSALKKFSSDEVFELFSKSDKKGTIRTVKRLFKGNNVTEVYYLVSPRGKNENDYNESQVKMWEFQAMSDLLETYYNKNYKAEEVSKGIKAFKRGIVVIQTTSSASTKGE